MNQEYQQPDYSVYTGVDAKTKVNTFIQGVYLWMAVALAITGLVSYIIGTSFDLISIFITFERKGRAVYATGMSPVWWICAVVELGLVFFFQARLNRLSSATATIVFVVYSALAGVTLAPIFVVYTKTSIASVFFICAITFAATSVFGFVTKINLAGIANFLFMGVFGILAVSLANAFIFKSNAVFMAVGYIGVFVFIGLAAYYTQRMKNMALTIPDDASKGMIRKATLDNALGLYLSFINLFLMLLRIFGQRN